MTSTCKRSIFGGIFSVNTCQNEKAPIRVLFRFGEVTCCEERNTSPRAASVLGHDSGWRHLCAREARDISNTGHRGYRSLRSGVEHAKFQDRGGSNPPPYMHAIDTSPILCYNQVKQGGNRPDQEETHD